MSVAVSVGRSINTNAVIVLIALAAIAVTGCFEKNPPETGSPAQDSPKAATEQPAASPARERSKPQQVRHDVKPAAVAAPAKTPAPVCSDCGVITAITPVEVKGETTGAGAIAGAVAGAVIGNQVSDDKKKRRLAQVVGVAGGAVAGNAIEKAARKETHYQIAVKLDNGAQQTITQKSSEGLKQGTRVRIINGAIVAE